MIDVHTTNRVFILTLSGEIDLASAPAIVRALDTAVDGNWQVIVVECHRMTFIDIAGARPLADAYEVATDKDLGFFIVGARARSMIVLRLLDLMAAVLPVETGWEPAGPAVGSSEPAHQKVLDLSRSKVLAGAGGER
jgi:anti-anti-sigma factor